MRIVECGYHGIGNWKNGQFFLNSEKEPFTGKYIYELREYYFLNGKRHREDGCSVVSLVNDIPERHEYHLYGKKIEVNSLEEFLKIVKLKLYL